MKDLSELIYKTLISAIVDITNDNYLGKSENYNEKDYIKWLEKMSHAGRALKEISEQKLEEFSNKGHHNENK